MYTGSHDRFTPATGEKFHPEERSTRGPHGAEWVHLHHPRTRFIVPPSGSQSAWLTVSSRPGRKDRQGGEWSHGRGAIVGPDQKDETMPILPQEPDVYPEDLFDQNGAVESSDVQWWALYTLARREKDLMRRLRGLKVPFYGPLAPKKTRSASGRVRVSYIPLFPGYVFVCGDEEHRRLALTTNCISRVLPVPDTVELMHDLQQVRQLILSDAPLSPESRLQAGMRVRVRSGVLAGVEGVVIKRHGKDRLLVAVEFLQQGASVSLEDYEVEPLT